MYTCVRIMIAQLINPLLSENKFRAINFSHSTNDRAHKMIISDYYSGFSIMMTVKFVEIKLFSENELLSVIFFINKFC